MKEVFQESTHLQSQIRNIPPHSNVGGHRVFAARGMGFRGTLVDPIIHGYWKRQGLPFPVVQMAQAERP